MLRSGEYGATSDAGLRTRLISWVRSNRTGLICTVVFAVLYAAIALFQYTHFVWSSWDLGIFTQVVEQYARLQAPLIPIKGSGVNALGEKFLHGSGLVDVHPIEWQMYPIDRHWSTVSGGRVTGAQRSAAWKQGGRA